VGVFFNNKRFSSYEFLSVVVIVALGIPNLNAHTICTLGLTDIALKLQYAEKLKNIHSSILDPEVAQFATELRKAWIRTLLDSEHTPYYQDVVLTESLKRNTIEALNRGIAYYSDLIDDLRAEVKPSGRLSFTQSERDMLAKNQERLAALATSNLEALKAIKLNLKTSDKVTYLDFQNVLRLILQPYAGADELIRVRGEKNEKVRQNFFRVNTPLITEDLGHLGFRKLNDWSAVAVTPIEFPKVEAVLKVDGNSYDFKTFIGHDDGHGNELYGQMYRDALLSSKLLTSTKNFVNAHYINSISDSEFVSLFMKHLEERVERYTKIRKYIDSIQDRKKRILAEGYWFYFTHELNIGYSEQTVIDDTLRNYRNFGSTRFDSFDDFALSRFRSRGDLGQAFKDPSWITTKDLKEIRKGFEYVIGLRFNI
jgi:hypothetical protein